MPTLPTLSPSVQAATIEDGIRALAIELRASGNPLRQAVALSIGRHPEVILNLIRQDLAAVCAFTPERVAEIIADLAACTGPAQRG